MFLVSGGALYANTNLSSGAEGPRLRPPRTELPPGFWEQHGWWVALLSALGLAVVALVVWFLSRPRREQVIPPATWARQVLEPLRSRPEDGALISHTTQVLRQYMAAAFVMPSDEMTTTEFCRLLAEREAVGPELCTAVSQFLRQCDEQKFAPSQSVSALGSVTQVLKLIELAEGRLTVVRSAAAATSTAGAPGAVQGNA
jgi:hypothetical protein